ncbi:hypothetical protein BDZ88DRAFT_413174, partial [Geranomyces variabilis]
MASPAPKLAVAALLLAYAPGVLSLCRCSCGGRSGTTYASCSAFSCQREFGSCPYGWRAYNQNGGIIGGSVGGFFFLLMLFCCCCLLMRRRRRMRGVPMVQELRIPQQQQPGMHMPYGQQAPPPTQQQYPQPYEQQPPAYPPPAHAASASTLDGSHPQYAPPPGPPPPQKGGKFGGFF